MGRVFAGCDGSRGRADAYGMGMMNGTGGAGVGSGMMGRNGTGHQDWSTAAVIAVAALSAVLAGGLVALLVTSTRRGPPTDSQA